MRKAFKQFILILSVFFITACDPLTILSSSPALLDKAGDVFDSIVDDLKSVTIGTIRIVSSEEANQKTPIALDLVFFDNEELKKDLLLLDGQSWFKKSPELIEQHKDNIFVVNFEIPRKYDTGRLSLDLDWPFLFVFIRYNGNSVEGRYVVNESGFLNINLLDNEVELKVRKEE